MGADPLCTHILCKEIRAIQLIFRVSLGKIKLGLLAFLSKLMLFGQSRIAWHNLWGPDIFMFLLSPVEMRKLRKWEH